ncbi:DENN domain-containing protein 5B [Arachis hypogaea]|nr:DENN domain-containing protein 5B [Arachis hypogaea]
MKKSKFGDHWKLGIDGVKPQVYNEEHGKLLSIVAVVEDGCGGGGAERVVEKESASPSWGEVVGVAVVAVSSPTLKDDHGGSQFQRLHNQVTKMIKGFSRSPNSKNAYYNPEILTSLKHQWATDFQLQHIDHRSWKEPSQLFESMVGVGLHLNYSNFEHMLVNDGLMEGNIDGNPIISQSSLRSSSPENIVGDAHPEHQMVNRELQIYERISYEIVEPTDPETGRATTTEESSPTYSEDGDQYTDAFATNKHSEDKHLPNALVPLMRYCQYESSESSCRYMSLNLITVLS